MPEDMKPSGPPAAEKKPDAVAPPTAPTPPAEAQQPAPAAATDAQAAVKGDVNVAVQAIMRATTAAEQGGMPPEIVRQMKAVAVASANVLSALQGIGQSPMAGAMPPAAPAPSPAMAPTQAAPAATPPVG